ncbi:MAG: DUF1223 domain-containing protein [Verrucomicrobiota bacterium]
MITTRCLLVAMFACVAANAAPVVFQSSERQTVLMELYTSEGCSSCPPAESWLSGMKKEPGLWSDFVPVAFHVEYWNYLGWRDKWSSKQFSDRQQNYAAVWGIENIYTPEFVLNGKEWHNWFGFRGAPGLSGTITGILKVVSEDTNRWQASFSPAVGGTTGYEVNAALLDSELSSYVKAGEDEGRHLNHDFAALTLVKQPLTGKDGGFQGEFTLDITPKATNGRLALAVWVTCAGELEPLQSVGGWLPKPGGN